MLECDSQNQLPAGVCLAALGTLLAGLPFVCLLAPFATMLKIPAVI